MLVAGGAAAVWWDSATSRCLPREMEIYLYTVGRRRERLGRLGRLGGKGEQGRCSVRGECIHGRMVDLYGRWPIRAISQTRL